MEMIFTFHVKYRMLLRGISCDEIRDILLNPAFVTDARDNRKIAKKKTARGTISVIYKIENDKIIIITIYWG